jgi:hypothetical protein
MDCASGGWWIRACNVDAVWWRRRVVGDAGNVV